MADTSLFYRFAHRIAWESGRPHTFAIALGVVAVWAISGPVFGFSETWQLIINTGTTIVTFLMVFLLQYTQNRDGEAVQAKLDELILVTRASNTFIGAERLSSQELERLRDLVAQQGREHDERESARANGKTSHRAASTESAARSSPKSTGK